ncbi:hypothetical protein [Bradyrhizobium sp. Arg816]|uniref:hypothetical protein n=1 Tax=Bradyrhizobium sp. Arg816 TaxID=2998491 RepID=UPI00249F4B12|nr:hypothetical protein [Bradyrhizobium sp. Arg816]MDI3566252.1 hypothetical protein [Bradyrhizobium sp. Arg816]
MQKPRLAGAFGVCNVFRADAMRVVALGRPDQDLSEAAAVQIGRAKLAKIYRAHPDLALGICGGPRDRGDEESKARR